MPVRLIKPYGGLLAGQLYWEIDQGTLRAVGIADDNIELATDYSQWARTVTAPTATISRNAIVYRMISASGQTLTLPLSGFWPAGTVITVVQKGAGATTVTPGTGVTINNKAGAIPSAQTGLVGYWPLATDGSGQFGPWLGSV